MFEFDPDNFKLEDLSRMAEQSREGTRRLEKIMGSLRENTGEAENADGMISAVVDNTGKLQRIDLNPRVMRKASRDLAEQITAVVRAAQEDAQKKARDLLNEAVGDHGDSLLFNQDRLSEWLRDFETSFTKYVDDRYGSFEQRIMEQAKTRDTPPEKPAS